jgi:hypothetical protein
MIAPSALFLGKTFSLFARVIGRNRAILLYNEQHAAVYPAAVH